MQEHLFLRNWDSVREIHAYPPSTGAYAIYRKSDFYAQLDHAAKTFASIEEETLNPVFRNGPMQFCVERFAKGGLIFPNLTWTIDFAHVRHHVDCVTLPHDDQQLLNFSSKDW